MSFATALAEQAGNNAALGSPFTARILRLLARNLRPGTPLSDRMFAWPGDIGPHGASLPLRLLGGLHALVLSHMAPKLAAVYPPNPAPDDAVLWAALRAALTDHATFLDKWIDHAPQTNEVRRGAVLIAAGHMLAARHPLPLVLSELGASGGLNLMWDRFALSAGGHDFGPADASLRLAPDWRGPCPAPVPISIAKRRGTDLNPLDPSDPDDALRLLAYVWADQPERLARTRAAIALAQARVDRADAADWLEARLANPQPGALHLVWHTIAWQYFPRDTQARCNAALQQAGAEATPEAPLAHLSMEADGGHGAALRLQSWPGGQRENLARVDFHGRWVEWRAD